MFKARKCKAIIALMCVCVLLAPYFSTTVMAAYDTIYKQSDLEGQTKKLASVLEFKEGNCYSVENTRPDTTNPDPEKRTLPKVILHKIGVVESTNQLNKMNSIYCVDEKKIFPGYDKSGNPIATDYINKGYITDLTKPDISSWHDKIGDANYKSVLWIVNNMCLDTEYTQNYDNFLKQVFADYISGSGSSEASVMERLKENLCFDDVNAIQQLAIWYFTNPTSITVDVNESMNKAYEFVDAANVETKYTVSPITIERLALAGQGDQETAQEVVNTAKNEYMKIMYSYLVFNAIKNSTTTSGNSAEFTLPEFRDDTNNPSKADVDGENYKIGPFTITDTTADASAYEISLTDGSNELTGYTLKDSNGTVISNIADTVGKTFYVYLPTTTKVTSVEVKIEYKATTKTASFWKKVDDAEDKYQPVIWVSEDNKPDQRRVVPIEKSDLALRKYIVSVNGDSSVARKPVVDATGLLNGAETAIYKHKKEPVEIFAGDKVVYEIRVYNEGKTDATVSQITDFIPDGLEYDSTSSINQRYGWTVSNGIATISLNEKLDKINNDRVTNGKNTLEGGLSTTFVQIELKLKANAKTGEVLTNVAEITGDNIADIDSTTSSIKKEDINQSTFSGNKNNKDDLTDSNYFYEGLEDDDDFEKVKVGGKVFDLNLKKFITKLNGKAVEGREPKYDTASLATSTNATYTLSKDPVLVKKGDIVEYTIRVYNEGDLDGWAEKIADYIPEGLGFVVNHKTNYENEWKIDPTSKNVIELKSIENAINNVKLTDFENTESLDDVNVIAGKAKIETQLLSSNLKSNKIKAYDGGKTLDSKDVKIVCVVLADEVKNNNLKNIAEITDDSTPSDEDDTPVPVDDRDSTPDTVNPDGYPSDDEKKQDDHDYELLTMKKNNYDLALQKFITGLNGEPVNGRTPTVTYTDGKIKYNHSTDPFATGNNDLVEYTIRVYNEGETDAYASEVADDIPKGLIFVPENETNIENGWQLFDKAGNITKDINQAVTVRSSNLSKEYSEKNKENNLLKAFDPTKPISTDPSNPNPDYRDLKIVFKVDEKSIEKTTTTESRVVKNTAEITEETDEDGNPVIDIDSTPNNWKPGEDDIDIEQIYIKYFDLALKKSLVKVIVNENGNVTEYNVTDDQLFKVEINKKKLKSTIVKFVYNITITNEGDIEGYAKEIKDYIPEGLEFVSDDNQGWYKLSDNVIATDKLANTLIKPKESASVQVTLKWINSETNLGKKVNVAEISKDENKYGTPDIDSTPDNKVPDEDDIDDAPVLLSISTGTSGNSYTGLIITVSAMMITGIVLIKKFVL